MNVVAPAGLIWIPTARVVSCNSRVKPVCVTTLANTVLMASAMMVVPAHGLMTASSVPIAPIAVLESVKHRSSSAVKGQPATSRRVVLMALAFAYRTAMVASAATMAVEAAAEIVLWEMRNIGFESPVEDS